MIKHTLTFEQSFVEATQEVQLSHHVDLTIMIGWKEVKVGVDGDVATRRKKMILTSGDSGLQQCRTEHHKMTCLKETSPTSLKYVLIL